ncbi:hypothetical protein B0H63DRAFT_487124 [Podospora didyma]|uniref:Secreted protein n=1 Tax=Podospora didyma TaxID=330526 RepID=A0AAE0K5K4_9PEZI|nr:hypothetical protein B0H63DRAFT_487124 [Podospora didyma]
MGCFTNSWRSALPTTCWVVPLLTSCTAFGRQDISVACTKQWWPQRPAKARKGPVTFHRPFLQTPRSPESAGLFDALVDEVIGWDMHHSVCPVGFSTALSVKHPRPAFHCFEPLCLSV